MLLQSIFAITTVILEVPTGYFADVYTLVQALEILAIATLISGIVILVILRRDKII